MEKTNNNKESKLIDFSKKFSTDLLDYEDFTENKQSASPLVKTQQESLKRSSWEDEEEEEEQLYSDKDSFLQEIHLYNPSKSKEENFGKALSPKFLLVRVENTSSLSIDTVIPDQFSKIVVDMSKMEEYEAPEFLIVDYDTIFGTRLTSFINYNSKFFTCDERVFFEALLIKYKAFRFKSFFWSKEVVWRELGIKKDRCNRIIKKFIELEILSTEVKKSFLDGRPHQITFFNLQSKKICELLPQIYNERESNVNQITELKKYLNLK